MARHSELVKIPRIDRYVSKLALGSAPLGGLFTAVSDEEGQKTILAALDSGINFIDTAPLYAKAKSDRMYLEGFITLWSWQCRKNDWFCP